MFLWISLNYRPLNLLLVRSHQPETIQGRSNVARVQIEPIKRDRGCRKNDVFTFSAWSAILPTYSTVHTYGTLSHVHIVGVPTSDLLLSQILR